MLFMFVLCWVSCGVGWMRQRLLASTVSCFILCITNNIVDPVLKHPKTPHPALDPLIGLFGGDAQVTFFAVVAVHVVHVPIILEVQCGQDNSLSSAQIGSQLTGMALSFSSIHAQDLSPNMSMSSRAKSGWNPIVISCAVPTSMYAFID